MDLNFQKPFSKLKKKENETEFIYRFERKFFFAKLWFIKNF